MMQRLLILTFAIVLALMTACGGGNDPETESEATVEAAPISEATKTPEPAAEPVEATTAPSPTAEATIAPPTSTLAPTPTNEPAAVPAETTMEEEPPSGDDTAASGDGWGASGSVAQSACDHPYFPMRAGSSWTFSDGENTLMWEVTSIEGDMDQATAGLRITIDDVVIEHVWNCTAGEGMASFEYASLGVAPTDIEMTLENQTLEGVFLLPADQLVPGASWEQVLLATFVFRQGTGNTEIEVDGELTSEHLYTVTGSDPVTFDGQSFDGVQVHETNVILMIMNILGSSVSQDVNIDGSYELGRGIGMVRQVTSSDFGTDTVELVSFFIP
jgi:hypothetical protein